MVKFTEFKKARGWLDFSDLEQLAFHLLRDHAGIIAQLKEDLDLLVVDEFQDTSPIQLALFMQLAGCAKHTVWVGDVKQAIYGFRNSDPVLIDAVVKSVDKAGGLAEPLSVSYRSLPDLVQLTNSLFVPAFADSLKLPENQVRLKAVAEPPKKQQAAIEFLELSSGVVNKGNGNPKKLTADLFWAPPWPNGLPNCLKPKFPYRCGAARPVNGVIWNPGTLPFSAGKMMKPRLWQENFSRVT